MTGDKRILILEDEPLIAMDLEDLLVANGYTVVGPYSAAPEALGSLDQLKPHAALLDVYLFNGLSFEVARELKRRNIPFAFMTGLVVSDLLPADLAGARVILKPYNEKELLSFVASEQPARMNE
ncbi:response regulator [Pleomorphomonas sp. PLEO]|uniref:response regulator n=1 Tax=Pleomorphomonas sp. PLEO TaxID=3239306 RepID=UPI00351E34A7